MYNQQDLVLIVHLDLVRISMSFAGFRINIFRMVFGNKAQPCV